MSTVNGHVKDTRTDLTIWWQEREAHWSNIARELMMTGKPVKRGLKA